MHDLIHDFAQSISETAIVDKESVNKLPSSIRHLNVVCGGETVPTILRDAAPKLRTLLFSDNDTPNGVQSDFKRLRVLHVRLASDAKELSKCFGKSKSLRYLDISCTNVKEFPKFIKKLYSLQTFRFMDCESLQMPPEGLRDLINLSHIYFSDEDRMPANLGSLTNLQTLEEFYVGKRKGRRIGELGSLRKLRGKLTIHYLERVEGKSEAESARLHEKALDELCLYWWNRTENCDDNGGVLEGLQPHSGLQRLLIDGFGGTCLPSWMLKSGELRSLIGLSICNCSKLRSFPEEMLGGLTRLKTLEMGLFCEDLEEFIGLSSIHHLHSSLEELTLYGWEKLTELPQQIQHLTALRKLGIWNFKGMEAFPDWLANLPSLETLHIVGCPKLKNLPSSPEVIKRLSKLNHVFTNDPYWPELEEMIRQEKQSANQNQ